MSLVLTVIFFQNYFQVIPTESLYQMTFIILPIRKILLVFLMKKKSVIFSNTLTLFHCLLNVLHNFFNMFYKTSTWELVFFTNLVWLLLNLICIYLSTVLFNSFGEFLPHPYKLNAIYSVSHILLCCF